MPVLNRARINERGQVALLFALLLPVILGLGSVVMTVGSWYVHKKHLQTLVDAGALAAGPAFTGCSLDPTQSNNRIRASALQYSGDTTRDPATQNVQVKESGDVRVVVNSNRYWAPGDVTDGAGLDFTLDSNDLDALGDPCNERYVDVKATDEDLPLLFRWLPATPSPKAHAKVEIRRTTAGLTGMLPFGVPEVDPVRVGVVFVDEDGNANSTSSISGTGFLSRQTLAPNDPLAAFNVWRGDISGVDLNGNENYNTVIVISRDQNLSLSGNLSQICNQNSVQTFCYGGDTLASGISFIHSYSDSGSGSASAARIRQVELAGGCGQSAPYFNLDNGTSCGAIVIRAKIDFGVTGNPTGFPTCARATASPGGAMTWSAGGVGGSLGTWTASFVPGVESGENEIDISTRFKRPSASNCNQTNAGASFNRVGAPYVAYPDESGPVQHLMLENLPPSPAGFTNSINGDSAANVRVTVGLTPPLQEAALSAPPIRLRIRSVRSQGWALRCDGNGANVFRNSIIDGCGTAYQVNNRNGSCAAPMPTPPDCIDTENGNMVGPLTQGMNGRYDCTPSAATADPPPWYAPNNWNGVTVPPETDPRWVTLFIVDDNAYRPGRTTIPIRRFGAFYITAADGLGCPGDNPTSPGQATVWGHFGTYVTPRFGAPPSDDLCIFGTGELCVPTLVE